MPTSSSSTLRRQAQQPPLEAGSSTRASSSVPWGAGLSCCCSPIGMPPSQAPDPCHRARALSLSRLQALCDLEANSNDLKAELRELYIVSAKEVDVTGRKAVVIFVPFKLLKVVHKIQSRLVRELEKKFSGKHVVLIGQRRIMRKPSAGQRQPKQKRPVSR